MIKKSNTKHYWNKNFHDIPEVLTTFEVAQFLRVSEEFVSEQINIGTIKTIPGTKNRIFKGFLFAFMTQNNPKDVGLMGGNPKNELQEVAIGF